MGVTATLPELSEWTLKSSLTLKALGAGGFHPEFCFFPVTFCS